MRQLFHKGPAIWWWQSLTSVLLMNVLVLALENGKVSAGGVWAFLLLTLSGFDVLVTLTFLLFSIVYFRYRKHGGRVDDSQSVVAGK